MNVTVNMKTEIIVPQGRPLYWLCIGTDRSTGDSFGPLVGTMLKEHGVPNVFGCLDEPVHAMNLEEIHFSLPDNAFIVAIDACLGQAASVGRINVVAGPTKPGAGVGKDIGQYGDASIHGIVNVGGFMEYFVLQNTRLSLVMEMARLAADVCRKVAYKHQKERFQVSFPC